MRSITFGPGLAIAAGSVAGFVMIYVSALLVQVLGVAMFFCTPFIVGALVAAMMHREPDANFARAAGAIALLFPIDAALLMLARVDGAICILMAMPLALPVALLGGLVGFAFASGGGSPSPVAAALLLPVALALEPSHAAGVIVHEVQTSIIVEAPPERVWPHVIAFAPMDEPPDWWGRLGIASPRYARIDGAGVNAVRYCVFTTGPFVEPIRVWDVNRRLAFDVVSQPPPLRELTPYQHLTPPHLEGYLRSVRGEFRLTPLYGGRTRLEGSTWYQVRMAPEGYWQVYADALIGRIHHRVLDHIKREVESVAP